MAKAASDKNDTLKKLLPPLTLLYSAVYLAFVIYSFAVKDYSGVFWRYLLIPGLAVTFLLQGCNCLIKKDKWIFTLLSFGAGIILLIYFGISLLV